ncbi:MAG: hypothetical protein L3J56_06140 [Bacteroidales bacterium]|nr:hypothetical protein [Bacteroidales bacterium]
MPIFDKHKSRIKLWVGTGKTKGNVHYSILTQDNKTVEQIINKMTSRILKKHYKNNFRLAIFYDNNSGKEIKRISSKALSLNTSTDRQTAKIKLWIGFPDNEKNATWYNLELLNNLDNTEIIRNMTEKILRDKYNYDFTTAIFYNNISGIPLMKVNGKLKKR